MKQTPEETYKNKLDRTYETYRPKSDKKRQKAALVPFQKYRRLSEMDDNQNCECISCGKVDHYKEMDGGHYMPSDKHLNTQFWEDNVWPQCKYCNGCLKGNLVPYRIALIKKIGLERVITIEEIAKQITQYTTWHYSVYKNYYASLLNQKFKGM